MLQLLRTAIFGALGAAGCRADLGECSDKPRAEDGLHACDNGLVRREPSAGCLKDPNRPGTCESDSDCGERQICYCGPAGFWHDEDERRPSEAHGACFWSSCKTSADCGEGNECVLIQTNAGCYPGQFEFICTTGNDECLSDEDCVGDDACFTSDGKPQCSSSECGRPFLIDGTARVAEVTRRSDWSAAASVRRSAAATASAEYWLRTAQLEHASVAAFARFTLELLALGAPSDLVSGASHAMADEIRHAELAFGLASAYAGHSFGPGPLPVDGALSQIDPADIAERLFLEGCVGETVAAAEARTMATVAEDEAARDALLSIADDETRHAELAWRALAWMLEVHPSSRVGFVRAFASVDGANTDARSLRGRVIDEVVRPACALLVAGDVSAGKSDVRSL